MTGCHGDHDSRLPHVEPAHAVADRDDRVGVRGGVGGDAVQGLLRVGVRAVLQRHDGVRCIGVGVAHAPDEGGHGARRGVLDGVEVHVEVEGLVRQAGDADGAHEWSPPAS